MIEMDLTSFTHIFLKFSRRVIIWVWKLSGEKNEENIIQNAIYKVPSEEFELTAYTVWAYI